ncbi:hypothetical protein ISS37_07300 [candidate division KSB1 bacterium]|nr:hypothetical protein [candidate division KSB1 bacterium]
MSREDPKSAVCFPFKKEDVQVFTKNIKEVIKHPKVGAVICVGYEKNDCFKEIEATIPSIEHENSKKVHLMLQTRLGTKRRAGKGDGMNTALNFFISRTPYQTIHFYDADILTFSQDWITCAEKKLKDGFDVVRFFFPRVSTDAMITWNITKCGLASCWPHTILANVEQPLGGELAIKREVALRLANDSLVLNYSDWAVDTAYTLGFCRYKVPLYESYIEEGKLHKLYGKLTDLYTMLIECFSIIKENQSLKIDTAGMVYKKDAVANVPKAIREKKAFDLEGTIPLLRENWTKEEVELLDLFPTNIREGMLACSENSSRPDVRFISPEAWYEAYKILLANFLEAKKPWQELLFHLWLARVLNHTIHYAAKGYDYAMQSLYDMISYFEKEGGP